MHFLISMRIGLKRATFKHTTLLFKPMLASAILSEGAIWEAAQSPIIAEP